jgi:hypothetical protein
MLVVRPQIAGGTLGVPYRLNKIASNRQITGLLDERLPMPRCSADSASSSSG